MTTTQNENLATSLSGAQRSALLALTASKFETASALGVSARSLGSLVELGIADRFWMVQSDRRNDLGLYRITGRGVVVRGLLKKMARA